MGTLPLVQTTRRTIASEEAVPLKAAWLQEGCRCGSGTARAVHLAGSPKRYLHLHLWTSSASLHNSSSTLLQQQLSSGILYFGQQYNSLVIPSIVLSLMECGRIPHPQTILHIASDFKRNYPTLSETPSPQHFLASMVWWWSDDGLVVRT